MTSVIGPDGELREIQLGAGDVLNSMTLVKSLWDSFGGLSGIRFLLDNLPNLISRNTLKDLEFEAKDFPATSHILTPTGIAYYHDPDPAHCFGGDPRTQMVGFTICALAHFFDAGFATRMFMKCLAPRLLQGYREVGAKEEFHSQLSQNEERIINEGAARGLATRFEKAVKALSLPVNTAQGGPKGIGIDDRYVGGLLRWIISPRRGQYCTRSATVARVGACLKEVGWPVGTIRVWSNTSHLLSAHEGLTLVVAGRHKTDEFTDEFMMEEDELDPLVEAETPRTHHYHFETIGAMLYMACGSPPEPSVEAIQTEFGRIHAIMRKMVNFSWATKRRDQDGIGPALLARPIWQRSQEKESSIAIRLGCLFLSTSLAERIAPCFNKHLFNDKALQEIRGFLESTTNDKNKETPVSVQRWKITIISILLSLVEILGGEDYSKLQHSTQLDLCRVVDYEGRNAMTCLAGTVSELTEGLPMSRVVELIALFHGGLSFHSISAETYENAYCIGFRNGMYSVLPSLLFQMTPTLDALGFRCSNLFYANAPIDRAGFVNTNQSDAWTSVATSVSNPSDLALVRAGTQFVSVPACKPPDTPIYTNFERQYDYAPSSNTIMLAARLGGDLIGFSSIFDVLATLASSLANKRENCPGHAEKALAFNVNASSWTTNRYRRPMDGSERYHTYIPVHEDPFWTLFLAGQAMGIDGRICFGCYDCTLEADGRHPSTTPFPRADDDYPRVYIGFK